VLSVSQSDRAFKVHCDHARFLKMKVPYFFTKELHRFVLGRRRDLAVLPIGKGKLIFLRESGERLDNSQTLLV